MPKELRVHHLLCIPLFRGAGYSGAFSKNMTEKIRILRENPAQQIRLICGTDMICGKCPNKNPDGTCGSDCNHVAVKDRELLPVFGFEEGQVNTAEYFFKESRKRMTKEAFDASCGNCEWYRLGYCSYEEYQKSVVLAETKSQ